MKIIDDALPASIFFKLKNLVEDPKFAWFYGRRVNSRTEDQNNPFLYGWQHSIGQKHGDAYDVQNPELWLMLENSLAWVLHNTGQELNEIWRMRVILNTTANSSYLSGAHVDYERPHQTALIYIDNSDGDTVIYKDRYNPILKLYSDAYWDKIQGSATEEMHVQPKENRMFLFDGLHYHAGTMPVVSPRRILININYTVK